MRIFIIHNDLTEISSLKINLENARHIVNFEIDKDIIREYLVSQEFDLIIMNSRHDDLDILEVIKQFRAEKKKTPILFLSTKEHGLHQGILALETGADDFITSPVNMRELLARANVLYRRFTGHYHRVFTYGPLEVDSIFKRYKLDGKSLELSRSEGNILEVLIRLPEHLITKEKLASNLFPLEDHICFKRIEPHMSRLRKKIRHPDVEIRTVYRSGYTLMLKEA